MRAIERRSLPLDDPENRLTAAGETGFSFPVINPVGILVTAGLIQGVAISPVTQRRTFIPDCFVKDFESVGGDEFDPISLETIGGSRRMHCRAVQNLAGVQVSDSGDCLLVEHQNLNGPGSSGANGSPVIGIGFESVGTKF